MKTNVKAPSPKTYEGGPSIALKPLEQLRRMVLACMLWEDSAYQTGESTAATIAELCNHVPTREILALARCAHTEYMLRHVPLFLIVQALKKADKSGIKEAIVEVCSRPDQITELLALYWKAGKRPLASQLKRGIAKAYLRFDEYQLAKYNRPGAIKLADPLRLCHPKPKSEEQSALFRKLAMNEALTTPDTWEVALSGGADKKKTFSRLLGERKLGKLAALRNVRNMKDAGLDPEEVRGCLMNGRPLLPFQYLGAAKACPEWESIIDAAMTADSRKSEKLPGRTIVLIDVSGSMRSAISGKSQLTCMDAACAFAILLRECCEQVFMGSFSEALVAIPDRRGMALRDAIVNSQPHGGTALGGAIHAVLANPNRPEIDRFIIITDEQTRDVIPSIGKSVGYILNISNCTNGLLYTDRWTTISGFSEASIRYINAIEKSFGVD